MSLYPSLEDAKVDEMAHAEVANAAIAQALSSVPQAALAQASSSGPYAGLLKELEGFDTSLGGLDVSENALALHMPKDHVASWLASDYKPLATITKAADVGIARSAIRQGVRPVTLAKDKDGKLGVAIDAWDKGIFCAFVWAGSAAALGGLRFGDQILEINGQVVAGWTQKQTLKFLREQDPARVQFAIRDRPMMRTITMQKDSSNHCGFIFKKGNIQSIVKESSAARNGLLINHQIIEVNGQCVVGLADKDALAIIQAAPQTITITISPNFVYKHLVSKIGFTKIKKWMDHSVPEM